MKIVDLITSSGLTGFYFDDQKAIKGDAQEDGFTYAGQPQTAGFSSIRQKGESLSIMLELEDGQIAWGDCAAVQYSGAGGRDPLFLAEEFIPYLEGGLKDIILGQKISSFRQLVKEVNSFKINGQRLHMALQYGLSQALLDAVALAKGVTMTEVLLEEYNLPLVLERIPIFAQTGDARQTNADKMILKSVDVLPHGLINNVATKLGANGEKLLEYIHWLKNRVAQIEEEDYDPIFHIDVYGTIGQAFNNDLDKVKNYLLKLQEAASPYLLRLEGPVDVGSKEAQIDYLSELTQGIDKEGSKLEIVVDEWCNTYEDIKEFVDRGAGHMIQIKTPDLGGLENSIEAVLYCREKNVGAYIGGTCNETDRSARVCVHLSLATRPQQMLAKPGMGVDEGLMIVNNEMNRTLALLARRNKGGN